MAESELSEHGKKQLEAGKAAQAKAYADFTQATKGKPTPTQEENDEAALGKHIVEHEADGGNPDPSGQVEAKHLENKPGGGYQTRQAHAAPAPAAPSKSSGS
jgi:hypothetical protein